MERAVLLSDIEFLDGVHESDWERIEEESFLVNVSKPLNENQQVVLEWLKEEKEERCSFESAIYWYFEDDVEPDIISDRLTQIEFLQVLQAFAEWGMKEVAE
ncbi:MULTISPECIES: hypothetical protein [Enterococcus]|nr:hypothetical protein [Enterococcus raffinosus]MBX9039579.1 hypothetical protein [Enterococcus raffinosus]